MSARRSPGGWKTSPTGSLRFNRDFSRIGVGRVTCSAHTGNREEFNRRNAILTKLAEDSQTEVLRAFKAGRLSIEELVVADRGNRLRGADLLADLRLRVNLWDSIKDTLPRLGNTANTRKRYKVSFDALRNRGGHLLSDKSTVADLSRVDWRALHAIWDRSAADWNHLRRAISVLLSTLLGDKFHPLRRAVMRDFPKSTERHRVPSISPEKFGEILKHAPERVHPCLIVLALTGMRVGEYLACTKAHLEPESCRILVPGTKTVKSATPITVPEAMWPWVEAAIPSPLRYKWLRLHFTRAAKAAGVPGARLHDIRHCFAQWGVDAGIPESKIQAALRHVSPFQTRRYAEQQDIGEATTAVGKVLLKVLP